MDTMEERMVREKIGKGKKKSDAWWEGKGKSKASENTFLVDSGVWNLL